jgi:cathepsin B
MLKSIIFVALLALASARVVVDEDRIAAINAMGTTWKAGVNPRFANLTVEQMKTFLGVLPGKRPWVPRMEKKDLTNTVIPESFDSRTGFSQCTNIISQIRDQSACGSCWAFGGASAMSDRLCIASNGQIQVPLSTEDLVSCCDACGFGCGGGYPESAWQYFQDSGLVAESAYPYAFPSCEHHTTGSKPPCGQEQPTPACDSSKLKGQRYYGKSTYGVYGSVADIQNEIMTNGPVEGAFTVYEDFVSYKSGVYKHTSGQELGGHAIRVLGWGTENGTPYWLIANSWNEDWGDKGLFKILRGSDECGIEDGMVAGLIKL